MKWIHFQREDLKIIPGMETLGFSPEFSYEDKRRDRLTPDDPPMMAVNFKREILDRPNHTLVIWKISHGWQSAVLDNSGMYIEHQDGETIEEVLKIRGFQISKEQLYGLQKG